MRRRLITIVILLFAGAVVNVAVAWACALGSPTEDWMTSSMFMNMPGEERAKPIPSRILALHRQLGPPEHPLSTNSGSSGFGYDYYHIREWEHCIRSQALWEL